MFKKNSGKRYNINATPPAKRPKLDEGIIVSPSVQNDSTFSGSLTGLGNRLRDWMSWMAHFAANTTVAARNIFSSRLSKRKMTTESSKLKSWKVTTRVHSASKESLSLTRQPLHEERRFMSLHPSRQSFTLSPGNPFKDSNAKKPSSPEITKDAVERTKVADIEACAVFGKPVRDSKEARRKTKKTQNTYMDTARRTVRLDEKEQYQLLLNQHKKRYEGMMTYTAPSFESRGMQTERPATAVYPSVSAFSRESLSASSKKNMTKWIRVASGGEEEEERATPPEDHGKNTSSWQEPEVIDSDVEITKVELPDRKRASLQVRESPFFSTEWIQDLKKTISIDCKENLRRIHEQERKAKLMQEKREARLSSENMKLFERIRQRIILPESPEASDEEEDASQYPEMTAEMETKIEDSLRPNPPDEILVEGFRLSVTRRDMETLSGLNWLNDEIINFYMNMLMERGKMDNFPSVYAFNTFFYPKLVSSGHAALKRWTRKIDIFSYNFILIPVHLGMHWCLAVIDFPQKKIQYYDSMGGQNNECLHALSTYLKEECLDKKKTDFSMNDWKMEAVKNIPHQMNGSDCGMFALKYAEYITRNSKITFTQAHMPYFRRRMVYEILMKRLL